MANGMRGWTERARTNEHERDGWSQENRCAHATWVFRATRETGAGVVYIVMIQLYLVLSFGPVSCMQACTLYYGFMCNVYTTARTECTHVLHAARRSGLPGKPLSVQWGQGAPSSELKGRTGCVFASRGPFVVVWGGT